MNLKKHSNFPLDKFINFCLYDKKNGYYMKKNPFGKKGDFITAPNISILFSEMIAIWILSFWKNIGSPKKFNLVELGAGNGEMMRVLLETFKNFPSFLNSCKFFICEKSPKLIKIQKIKLSKQKISWIPKIDRIDKNPTIFVANEFFDSFPFKQFRKKSDGWFEKYVNYSDKKKPFFFEKKTNIKILEKKIGYEISKNQDFIEISEFGVNYFKNILHILKKNKSGLLLIDYGYDNLKMENTLQAIVNHKYSDILKKIGHSDITHHINFYHLKKIVNQFKNLQSDLTTQRSFLLKLGIKERAEIISKNHDFIKKADIYYRLKRLVDKKEMGDLFKVMMVRNKKNKFKLGF